MRSSSGWKSKLKSVVVLAMYNHYDVIPSVKAECVAYGCVLAKVAKQSGLEMFWSTFFFMKDSMKALLPIGALRYGLPCDVTFIPLPSSLYLRRKPSVHCIGLVAICRPKFDQLVPPTMYLVNLPVGRGIVCISHLLHILIQLLDQCDCSDGIHGHG